MKIRQSIAEIVSEFSGLNRTPDFKPVRSGNNDRLQVGGESQGSSPTPSGTSTPNNKCRSDRRHSVNIAVGVDNIPVMPVAPQSTESISDNRKYAKKGAGNRRQSAPCISTFAHSTSLKDKLNKMKRTNSDEGDLELKEEEEEEEELHLSNNCIHSTARRASISYQIVGNLM